MIMEGFRFNEHVIWGATGRMLRNFLDVAVAPVTSPSPGTQGTNGTKRNIS